MRADYHESINNNFGAQATQGVRVNAKPDDRLNENYTCKDQNWHTDTYNGDIYISTPNDTHNAILKRHADPEYKIPENGYPGTSGFFTDESTVSKHFTSDGTFDSVGLGHDLQQAPYHDATKAREAKINNIQYNPEYNGNLDCFRVNSDKMLENYGTTDFFAAQSKCMENHAWGNGGGFQGYNPYINEMINNGSLEYVPEKSRVCNENACKDYADRKDVAQQQAREVNNYIEENQIKGKAGEKLGHNELPHEENISHNSDSQKSSKKLDAQSELGGGSHAPPNNDIRGNRDNSVEPQKTPSERGKLEPQEPNNPSSKDAVIRGQLQDETEKKALDTVVNDEGMVAEQEVKAFSSAVGMGV